MNNKFILNHSILSFVLTSIGTLLLLIQNIIIARFFGDSLFGIFSFIINLFLILSIFAKFGIENLSLKEIPIISSSNQKSKLKGLYYFSYFRTLIFSLLICSFLTPFIYCSNQFNMHFRLSFQFIVIWFVIRMIVELLSFQLQALNKTISSRFSFQIIPPLISIILLFINEQFNFYTNTLNLVFKILLIGYVVSAILIVIIKKKHLFFPRIIKPEYEINKWMFNSYQFMILSGLLLCVSKISPLILSMYYPIEYVGYYTTVINISFLTSFGLSTTNKVLASKLSENYSNNNMKEFQENLTWGARFGFFISIILTIPLLLFRHHILGLYGENFIQLSEILVILVFGNLINSFCGPVGLSMIMTGKEKIVIKFITLSLLISIALSFILMPKYGLEGLAYANCLGIILWNVMLTIYAKKKYNYRTTILG